MNRKTFITNAAAGMGGIIAAPLLVGAQNLKEIDKGAPLPAEKVKEFVMAGHGNLDKVKSMLEELPALLYATWDWGGGDFETALEGAGHVGNKEIAGFLINSGARTNYFVLTMLGKTDMVKAFIEAFPQQLNARGPHGLTFLHHALKGGDGSKELVDYFNSKGLKDARFKF